MLNVALGSQSAFLYKPGRVGEHVSVCYKYRQKIFGMSCTTITAFELLLKRLDNRRGMRGKWGQVGASGGGGFGYCCRRLLEVDFETNKTQPDWSFQSFELRGNVTAKPEDVLAPCWRKVPLTGNG